MRMFSPSGNTNQSSTRRRNRYYHRWDYRWDTVPKECKYHAQLFIRNFIALLISICVCFCICSLYRYGDIIGRFEYNDISWTSCEEDINSSKILTARDNWSTIHLYWLWHWATYQYVFCLFVSFSKAKCQSLENTDRISMFFSVSFTLFPFAVYDVLTGKIVYSVRGHKDIVRDVAWHPSRNEILTSSWDYNVNLNFRGQKKKLPLKRSLKDVNQDDPCGNDDENADSAAPPPRRSRRLALRRQAQQSN